MNTGFRPIQVPLKTGFLVQGSRQVQAVFCFIHVLEVTLNIFGTVNVFH